MRILVTGANGQLGMSLRKIAARYPQHDFVFTDLPEADITDRAVMEKTVKEVAPDALVNCAACTAVDRAESEPEAAAKLNAAGPEILSSLAVRYGFTLAHISTDYVFDGRSRAPYKEADTPAPLNVYGTTKLEGERAIELSGADVVVVRTSWLYSEFGGNFVKTMLRLAGEGKEINVVDDQTGSPTYATDLARAVVALLEKKEKGFRIYNYAGGGEVTWYGFACMIFSLTGLDVPLRPVSSRDYPAVARRPSYSVLDTALVKGIGLEVRPLETSLGECLRAMGFSAGADLI